MLKTDASENDVDGMLKTDASENDVDANKKPRQRRGF
jgi:hypothetical protein